MRYPSKWMKRVGVVVAATVSTMLLTAAPAHASYNDSFTVKTTDGCGSAEFVDSGPYSNGVINDDFVKVHDLCADGHGVRVWLWFQGYPDGTKYNGNGLAGAPVYWDPFPDVRAGDSVEFEVCLVDGSADTTGSRCGWGFTVSRDG
jgi:hypothetical protein